MRALNVTVCGGGRTGHLDAALFARRDGVRVTWLTGNAALAAGVAGERTDGEGIAIHWPDGSIAFGRPDRITTDPAAAVGEADVVVITVPAQARPDLVARIAPHLPRDKPVFLGAIPGFCGFDWLAGGLVADRPNVVVWGMKDVPHTAFDCVAGTAIRVGGAKERLHVATRGTPSPALRDALHRHLERLFAIPVDMLADYLEITLTPGNPIMHASVIYGLIGPYGQWHRRPLPEGLCWWSDCPELGAYFLERTDEENQRIKAALEARLGIDLGSVKPLKTEIVEAYGEQIADAATMLSVLRTNRAYAGIPAPVAHDPALGGATIDPASRAFREDVAFGLTLLVEMGRRLDLATPHMSEILDWSVARMGGLGRSALDYVPANWPEVA